MDVVFVAAWPRFSDCRALEYLSMRVPCFRLREMGNEAAEPVVRGAALLLGVIAYVMDQF